MKILSIGAHQDDNEFRCAGIAAKYVKAGHEVRFLSVSDGSGGHHIMTAEQTRIQRAKESAAVAEFLHIQYDVWDIVDGSIVPDLKNRERLIRYIRAYSPDVIITHRTNDYHPDHRAVGQLVQDASYMLIVPHVCPDAPAMRAMPVILFNLDYFSYPPFKGDVVIGIDDVIDAKMEAAHLNTSQVYEWLPYTEFQTVPDGEAARREWLKGMDITPDTTDEEVLAQKRGYAVRFAKVAAQFRKELIARYGEEGKRIRYAEAFMVSEYGAKLTEEKKKSLFPF